MGFLLSSGLLRRFRLPKAIPAVEAVILPTSGMGAAIVGPLDAPVALVAGLLTMR